MQIKYGCDREQYLDKEHIMDREHISNILHKTIPQYHGQKQYPESMYEELLTHPITYHGQRACMNNC
jgi:hypothetical protein